MTSRSVRHVERAERDDIGELQTRRPLPSGPLDQIDPFLFLNHHGPQVYPPHNRGLPFGPHPHRGFETVTFILAGSLAHRDTGGHESVIRKGGVQWMTAGRGLEHAEISPADFLERGGPLEILQLWVNLPSRLKMVEPHYTGLQREAIPAIDAGAGVKVNLIAGSWGEHRGPIESLPGVQMTTLELEPGGTVLLPAPPVRNVFLYVARGEVTISGRAVAEFHLVDVNDDGDDIEVEALRRSVVLFGHADPIGEPVVAHGPFVMNTREEIDQAVADYRSGKFRGVLDIG